MLQLPEPESPQPKAAEPPPEPLVTTMAAKPETSGEAAPDPAVSDTATATEDTDSDDQESVEEGPGHDTAGDPALDEAHENSDVEDSNFDDTELDDTAAEQAATAHRDPPDTTGPDDAADDPVAEAPEPPEATDPGTDPAPAPQQPEPAPAPSVVTPYEQALAIAGRLAPDFVLPNDCRPPPLRTPTLMPNASHTYRSGVHQGVDFHCSTEGHPVVSALDGRVVVAAGDFTDPTRHELNALLDIAHAVGFTPPYTFAMLSGRHVVVDHGIIDGAGHVVTLYLHLDEIDPSIRVGMRVAAGQRLGGIGATGTSSGNLHLHWNIHVNGPFLGAGLNTAETSDVYTALFGHATDTASQSPSLDPGITVAGPPPPYSGPGTTTFNGREPLTEPISLDQALSAARRLSSDIVVPSGCGPAPPSRASLLPNARRAYRSGIHQGVDFMCSDLGEPVTAALGGRVLVARGNYVDPSARELNELLDTAATLGATPQYTLMALYGNHVVIDHGIIDGVGHVVTLYAHLDTLAEGIRTGLQVEAGQRLGTSGNTGTTFAAEGRTRTALHLHWELHIDGQYLGVGLSSADTRAVYTALFAGPDNGGDGEDDSQDEGGDGDDGSGDSNRAGG